MNYNRPINILYYKEILLIPIYSLDGRYYIDIKGEKLYTAIYNRFLKTQRRQGYLYNNVQTKEYQQNKVSYHRLIAEMFLLKKDDRDVINHKDGKRSNNSISNLEWVYQHENSHHGFGYENYKKEGNSRRLFSNDEIIDIYTSELTENEILEKYPKLTRVTYYDIKHDRTYKDITKNIEVGKSKHTIQREYLRSLSSSYFLNIWLEYISSDKTLRELQSIYNISSWTFGDRFKKLGLPLKENRTKKVYMNISKKY